MFPAFSCSRAGRAQCRKKAHQLQEIPLLKKWGWDKRPASPGHHSKDLLWSNPTQPAAKLRQAEEARKRRKCSGHPGGTGVSSVQLCRGLPELLPLWNQVQHSCLPLLQIPSVFTPRVFVLADARHLSPQSCFAFSALSRLRIHMAAAQASVAGCVQDASLQSTLPAWHTLDISPSRCALAPCCPDLTGLSSTCVITEIL